MKIKLNENVSIDLDKLIEGRMRFFSKVRKTQSHWFWTAATNGKGGYGIFRSGIGRDKYGSSRWMLAHRFSFQIANGIIPPKADLPAEAAEEARTVAELKSENTQLKRQLKQLPQKSVEFDPKIVEKAVKARDNFWKNEVSAWRDIADRMGKIIHDGYIKVEAMKMPEPPVLTHLEVPKPVPVPARTAEPIYVNRFEAVSHTDLSGPEQRILDAIALSESIGINEPEQTAVAFLAGYTYGGGGFNNPRSMLKTKGLVEYRGSKIALTDEGRSMARTAETPLTREMMHEKVLSILPGPEQKLLGPLLEAYPSAMSNEDLAVASGYTNGSGGFNNPRGRLRTLGLIDYPSSGFARAKDLLFP